MSHSWLNGAELTITTGEWGNEVIKKKFGNKTIWSGLAFDYFSLYQAVGNFTYNVVECNDLTYYNDSNGEWTGQLGKIWTGEADIAVVGWVLTSRRRKMFQFLEPPLFEQAVYMDIVSEEHGKDFTQVLEDLKVVFHPLQQIVWWTLLGMMVVHALFNLRYVDCFQPKNGVGVLLNTFEHYVRLFSGKCPNISRNHTLPFDFMLVLSSIAAMFITIHYCSMVNSESTVLAAWNAPFHDPKSMHEAGYR